MVGHRAHKMYWAGWDLGGHRNLQGDRRLGRSDHLVVPERSSSRLRVAYMHIFGRERKRNSKGHSLFEIFCLA